MGFINIIVCWVGVVDVVRQGLLSIESIISSFLIIIHLPSVYKLYFSLVLSAFGHKAFH